MKLYIDDLLYARFDKYGCGPETFNCWELCREIYRRAERSLPHYSDWIAELTKRDDLINAVKQGGFIKVERPAFLDIVTLRLRGNYITHVGCMIDNRKFIHVSKKKGVSITDINDRKWRGRIEGFYRYAGL